MTALWPGRSGAMLNYISPAPLPAWQHTFPRRLSVLGSTGSIGKNALDVVRQHPDRFQVVGLACARSIDLLLEQAKEFRPAWLAVLDQQTAHSLQERLKASPIGCQPEILVGPEGYATLASLPETDLVLSAQVGAAGLAGTLAAALAGKVIALANKESLVLAGDLLRHICTARKAVILPVDSEHNALFQCIAGRGQEVAELILTASGGPFRGKKRDALQNITPEQALKHPNWSMGAKISIDSATLMNKALEVIEACHLYGIPVQHLRVLVHPQSTVHSLARFTDGSMLAQMGPTDMRLPIAHCLLWPECLALSTPALDLAAMPALEFFEPDHETFPALRLARRALDLRGGSCVVLNAANEAAVALFLQKHCSFLAISDLVAAALEHHEARVSAHTPFCLPDTPMSSEEIALQAQQLASDIARLDSSTRQFVCNQARTGVTACS